MSPKHKVRIQVKQMNSSQVSIIIIIIINLFVVKVEMITVRKKTN